MASRDRPLSPSLSTRKEDWSYYLLPGWGGLESNRKRNISNTAFVSSEGLTDKGDLAHFDAKSARELGKRYAEAYLELIRK